MSYTIESVLEAYNKLQKLYKFNDSLKTDQVQAIVNIINKKHSLVVLPTGYGKTDIFMLTPLILDILKPDEKHYALVVVPLLSLMADMKLKYKDRGVDVVMVTQTQKMEAEELAGIKNGNYPIILVTPEILVDNKHWLDIFVKSPNIPEKYSSCRYRRGPCSGAMGGTIQTVLQNSEGAQEPF